MSPLCEYKVAFWSLGVCSFLESFLIAVYSLENLDCLSQIKHFKLVNSFMINPLKFWKIPDYFIFFCLLLYLILLKCLRNSNKNLLKRWKKFKAFINYIQKCFLLCLLFFINLITLSSILYLLQFHPSHSKS